MDIHLHNDSYSLTNHRPGSAWYLFPGSYRHSMMAYLLSARLTSNGSHVIFMWNDLAFATANPQKEISMHLISRRIRPISYSPLCLHECYIVSERTGGNEAPNTNKHHGLIDISGADAKLASIHRAVNFTICEFIPSMYASVSAKTIKDSTQVWTPQSIALGSGALCLTFA